VAGSEFTKKTRELVERLRPKPGTEGVWLTEAEAAVLVGVLAAAERERDELKREVTKLRTERDTARSGLSRYQNEDRAESIRIRNENKTLRKKLGKP
jgi:hypothetical protein